MLAAYGERAYRAALTTPGLYRFAMVGLSDDCDSDDLVPLLAKLRSRAVILWPQPEGREWALEDAGVLGDVGAAAVGIVTLPEGWPSDFQLGDELPENIAPPGIVDLVNATLRDATALALPIHNTSRAKQTRAIVPTLAPVDGAALFARLRAFLAAHLAEPQTTTDTIALWCLAAWAHEAFDVSPRLVLHASDARADHARALRLAAWLTPSPLVVSRTIAAHLLPVIAADRPTLLLDDAGATMLTYIDMRALIAAGALRDGAFLGARTRKNPSGWSPCFAPTAIATAARLPDDVRARAIVVPMSPPARDAPRAALPLADPPQEVMRLRADMQRWAKDARRALEPAAAIMPANGDPTARENWYPLIALAHALGLDTRLAAVAAMEALAEASLPVSSDLELLADVQELAGRLDADARVPSLELLAKLVSDPERAWATAHRGRKLTPRGLAERLGRFGIKPVVLRFGAGLVRGYRGDDLIYAFARYLREPPRGSFHSDA